MPGAAGGPHGSRQRVYQALDTEQALAARSFWPSGRSWVAQVISLLPMEIPDQPTETGTKVTAGTGREGPLEARFPDV